MNYELRITLPVGSALTDDLRTVNEALLSVCSQYPRPENVRFRGPVYARTHDGRTVVVYQSYLSERYGWPASDKTIEWDPEAVDE